MSKKILIICGSPYQILVANRIIEENYPLDTISIVLMNTIANVESVYQRAIKESRFAKTYLWKVKGKFAFSKTQRIYQAIRGWKESKKLLSNFEGLDEKYDVLLYANNSAIVMHTGILLLRNNPNLKIEMFEDGFSTYSAYIGNYLNKKNRKTRVLSSFFLLTSALYIFNPEIMDWNPEFETKKITPVFEGECLQRINRLFSYDELTDDYNKRVIFFEESYAADGKNVDDVDLVDEIASVVGEDNIFVKIHPRNPTNRFASKRYTTNTNISIPWEIILVNGDFSKTIFTTIASNAAMNPFFLFGIKIPAVLLFKCTKTPEALYAPIVKYDEKLCSKHPSVFKIPTNYEELKDVLNDLISQKENKKGE